MDYVGTDRGRRSSVLAIMLWNSVRHMDYFGTRLCRSPVCVGNFTHTPWTVTLFCICVSNLLFKLPHYGVLNVCVKTLVYIRPRVRVSFPFLFLD